MFALLLGMVAFGWWLTTFRHIPKAVAALDRLAAQCGLVRLDHRESAWVALRQRTYLFTPGPPMARGERDGCAVELGLTPFSQSRVATSWIVLVWPQPLTAGNVSVSRDPRQMWDAFRAGVLQSWEPRQRAAYAAPEGFGEAVVFGAYGELARVFTEALRDRLRGFARRLVAVGFDGPIVYLEWFGNETDPAIVESSFRLAADCASIVAGCPALRVLAEPVDG
jgi:hypothetical protein